jgi:hypothetical protein
MFKYLAFSKIGQTGHLQETSQLSEYHKIMKPSRELLHFHANKMKPLNLNSKLIYMFWG